MRALAILFALTIGTATQAQDCLVDNMPLPGQAEQFNAQMRALMLAHTPIEYRQSCGLTDESDLRYYNAIRAAAGCEASENYDTFFGRYLDENTEFLFAVTRTELMNDEAFETYCKIIERIDLTDAVTEDGTPNATALQVQAPLFHALQAHVKKWRISQ